jgi:hypothetical protein
LKDLKAMAAMANPIATNLFGRPGIAISVDCGRALMTSWKSSMEAEIVRKLMSVVVWAIVLKGSSCLSSSLS